MTYEELKIQLDLNESVDILKSIGRKTKDNKWFVVCDNGDCHLFGNNGNEIDVKKIKSLYEKIIPKDIKKITIPNSAKYIEDYAFYICRSLTSIKIPNSVENIGDNVFVNCYNLKSISIPDSVKHIGYNVFYNCKNLKSMAFKGKTIYQVKSMKNYPFGIENKSIIKYIN